MMLMRALADVSWLLPLCHGGHEHHASALGWFLARPPGDEVILCRVSQLGLLRLFSNPSVMGPDVCSTHEAWRQLDQLLSDPRILFAAEPEGLEVELRRVTKGFPFSPKLWQDAYLAAFAMAGDMALVTFDRGFKKFRNLRCEILNP